MTLKSFEMEVLCVLGAPTALPLVPAVELQCLGSRSNERHDAFQIQRPVFRGPFRTWFLRAGRAKTKLGVQGIFSRAFRPVSSRDCVMQADPGDSDHLPFPCVTPGGDLLLGWSLFTSSRSHGGSLMLFILDFVRQRKIQVL